MKTDRHVATQNPIPRQTPRRQYVLDYISSRAGGGLSWVGLGRRTPSIRYELTAMLAVDIIVL